MTEIGEFSEENLKKAAALIKKGEVVAFPTETVYGLGANALSEQAVLKIFQAKNRPADNPLIVHVSDITQVEKVAYVSDMAASVMAAFFPGSLTVVLPKKECVPSVVTAGLNTVGVRNPVSPEARRFLAACGVPVAAPSANSSTRPSPTCAEDVYEDMNGRIPFILKGAVCSVGIESTVLDLTSEKALILRPGIVTASEIKEKTGIPVEYYHVKNGEKVRSPGIKYRHYAPKCEMVLCLDDDPAKAVAYAEATSGKTGVLCEDKYALYFEKPYLLGKTAEEASERLFSLLRKAEKECDNLLCFYTLKDEGSVGVINRMTKASGGKII